MPILQIMLLAIIQGVTEFLPISSSGHLLLFHKLLEANAEASQQELHLLLDIAVHVGTLIAVCLYFWRDIGRMAIGVVPLIMGRWKHPQARLNIRIVISSIPVVLVGFLLYLIDPLWLRQTWVVATTTVLFGIALWYADERSKGASGMRTDAEMSLKEAFYIGCAQILALIPGTSRSGITMTASRFLGFSRTEAARYSLLLSTLAITGAGVLGTVKSADIIAPELFADLAIAACFSCVAAWIAVAVMMKWLAKQSFRIFAIYRIALGLVLFAAIALGWL